MNLNAFGILESHVSLKPYNTYRIETFTKYLLHPRNKDELCSFLKNAKENKIPYFILGNGSNVILSDTEYPGVIVKLDEGDFTKIVIDDNHVTVGAGVMIQALSYEILDHGLKGLEWASGIPGTIGGCIFGNAEAYKVCTFDSLESVTYLDSQGKEITKFKNELSYGYRTSFFKEHPENIIIEATFCFEKGNKEESKLLIEDRKKRRFESQPLQYPSAGSVFRNPSAEMPSWRYIDGVGLKSYQIGGAKVSEKHANFIVNVGGATGKDIRDLIQLIREKVKEKYGVDLVLEQEQKSW